MHNKLSSQQYEIWLSCQINPDNVFKWNIINEKCFRGNIDLKALQEAWKKLLFNHEILRAGFTTIDRCPHYFIHENLPDDLAFEYINCVGFPQQEVDQIKEKVFRKELFYKWDFKEIICKCILIQTSPENYTCFLRTHHLITDGKSIILLWQELSAIYRQILENGLVELPKVLQYKDFISYQQLLIESPSCSEKLNKFWSSRFTTPPSKLNLPVDKIENPSSRTTGSEIIKIESSALKTFCLRQRTTLSSIVLASFYIVLTKYSKQTDISIGGYFLGRNLHKDHDNIIGTFINVVPLRLNFNHKILTRDLIKETFITLKDANENQNISYAKLKDIAKVSADENLFSTGFNYSKVPDNPVLWGVETLTTEIKIAEFIDNELTLRVYEFDTYLQLRLDYNKNRFFSNKIKSMLENLAFTVETLKLHLDTPLHLFSCISPGEKQIIEKLSYQKNEYPRDLLLHEHFELMALAKPSATAVIFEDFQVTYSELNEKASGFASVISQQGIFTGLFVPVIIEHSVELIVTLLAILKVGAVYVPIDPTWPLDRIKEILDDLGADIIISDRKWPVGHDLFLGKKHIICDFQTIQNSNEYQHESNSIHAPFYIMYTSGSTGLPKGVIVPQKGILNRLFWMNNYLGQQSAQSVILSTRFVYDSSIWQILWPLINGGKCVIISEDVLLSPARLIETIHRHNVTTVDFVPSIFAFIFKELESQNNLANRLLGLRTLILGGEEINVQHVLAFKKRFPNIRVINLYGPTEASIGCIAYEVTGTEKSIIPIGKPISNVVIRILDDFQQTTPVGVPGEIYIGGDCLALGYLNQKEKTEKSFVTISECGSFYKTGDMAVLSNDDNIYFLGRNDKQIKLRGFRIELAEITNSIYKFGKINRCVLKYFDQEEDKFLCAYLVAEMEIEISQLKSFLHSRLPKQLVPKFFIQVPFIPLTSAGKTDFSKLQRPIMESSEISIPSKLTGRQKEVARLWASVLRIDRGSITPDSNFFELGGHSLNAIEFLASVYKHFKIDIPISAFFRSPTVKDVSSQLSNDPTSFVLEKQTKQQIYPLSSKQRRTYILHHLDDRGIVYNMPSVFQLKGPLDISAFEKSFEEILKRHEILRCCIQLQGITPMLFLNEKVSLSLRYRNVLHSELNIQLTDFIKPFDLSHVPLIRAEIFCLNEIEHVLIIDMHHIIADGIS
ncbi:MAG: amino acid adenylation domain-containing protein, partial [Flavisolibacter sp.]